MEKSKSFLYKNFAYFTLKMCKKTESKIRRENGLFVFRMTDIYDRIYSILLRQYEPRAEQMS